MKFKYTDYHIHTKWSHDIKEFGPSFEDYAKIAEKKKINICFLDHYELYYVENDKAYPFYGDKLYKYLEQVDKVKENYEFVLSGLEVDYYSDREAELEEFMDNYGNDLDFISGTIHEMDIGYPVTNRELLMKILAKKSVKQIVDEYFELSQKMINSRIFKNVCHIDTIFRYINNKDIKPTPDVDISDDRVLQLGRLCIKNNINIEYNLSGYRYPLSRPFPSKSIVNQLKNEGANIFVGSDSHSINYFRTRLPLVKKAYESLNAIK